VGDFRFRLAKWRRPCQKKAWVMAQIYWLQIWRCWDKESWKIEKEKEEKLRKRRVKISSLKLKWLIIRFWWINVKSRINSDWV
jgi:hypothetical protein